MHVRSATKRGYALPLSIFRRAALVAMLLTLSATAWGLDRGADGWFHTGDGVRVKKIAFVSIDVYSIGHDMKDLPSAKSKAAIIGMDTDKRFTWRMLRDVDKDKIQEAIKEAFAMNGYGDQSKIGPFVGAFSNDLQKAQAVTIRYDSTAKVVVVTVQGGGSATVAGVDFMKAVWSIWFGKIDQPTLGDALIKNM